MSPSVNLSTAYSRPEAAAGRVADAAAGNHRFVERKVLLTGDAEVLSTRNGFWAAEASLLLLPRICENVAVGVPKELGALRTHLEELAARIAFGKPITFLEEPRAQEFDATLRVGVQDRVPATIVVNSEGWIARICSAGHRLPAECSQSNPISALFAASWGVTEVFKRLLPVKPKRGRPIERLDFNLFSLKPADPDPGPLIPDSLGVGDAVLVGAGAIGNGVVYLLCRLPLIGHIGLVDSQRFGDENLGTCLLVGPSAVGEPKVDVLSGEATDGLRLNPYFETLEVFKNRLGKEIPHPAVVLSAVDTPEARHEIQDLWPDLIINGAIGDFPCEVGRHAWGQDAACMRCVYQAATGERAEVVLSRLTGLPERRLVDLNRPLTEDDVAEATPERRAFLLARVGKRICSIVDEARTQAVADGPLKPGFEPSAPFVATMSSALMVGELVKTLAGLPSTLEPRFQFDALVGPQNGQFFPEGRRATCVCRTRGHNIERMRNSRRSGSC